MRWLGLAAALAVASPASAVTIMGNITPLPSTYFDLGFEPFSMNQRFVYWMDLKVPDSVNGIFSFHFYQFYRVRSRLSGALIYSHNIDGYPAVQFTGSTQFKFKPDRDTRQIYGDEIIEYYYVNILHAVVGAAPSPFSFTLTVTPLAIVPEPSTWAMLIIGFGAVGASMRRRRLRGHSSPAIAAVN